MAEEKDTAAPAKRTAGKTGRRKKPEAEHAARAAPQDKDTGSKAQELLEQARTEPKPEWEVAEQVVLLPLDRLRPFKNHPFKVNDEDELMQDTIDSIMAGGVINPILVRPAEDGKFEVVSGHRRFRASELAGKADIKAIVREMDDDTLAFLFSSTVAQCRCSLITRLGCLSIFFSILAIQRKAGTP